MRSQGQVCCAEQAQPVATAVVPAPRRRNGLARCPVITSPYGIAGPEGTPPEVVDTLHHAFREAYEEEASRAVIKRRETPEEYLGPSG